MEPRELWERNTVLAEAFCASDEMVRRIQAELDEAQASRTRTLAAFAVTVGNDGSIADVMGLNEREVRVARRTVGKDDARTLAAELLRKPKPPASPAPQAEEASAAAPETVSMPGPRSEPTPAEPATPAPAPGTCATGAGTMGAGPAGAGTGGAGSTGAGTMGAGTSGDPAVGAVVSGGATSTGSAPTGSHPTTTGPTQAAAHGSGPGSAPDEPVTWSPAMDSVLLWSWQSGIDLQAVAAELDLDVRALLQRVQALAAEGLLILKPSHGDSGQAGRHRRHDDFFISAPDSPEALYTHPGYVTQPY